MLAIVRSVVIAFAKPFHHESQLPVALKPGRETLVLFSSRILIMLAIMLGSAAPLAAQNLYLANYTDFDFTVNVRYADVNCDYSSYPQYTPSNVCNPNVGTITYTALDQSQTNQTTPNGSQICSVNIYDSSNNLVASCGCGVVSCNVQDFQCLPGYYVDIDITITKTTTTIKWLP